MSLWTILPSKFNIVRLCIYITVLLWSIVCLAIAAHFQSVLSTSDLTRFVPLAIFVSVVSVLVMFCLIVFGLRRNMNPITTRVELVCLGLIGTLWLALGAFLASSDSQDADVECFAGDDSSTPVDDEGFTTETYQAQYRVLLAFALFNVILVCAFLALLLLLAIRRYLAGDKDVWYTPVPAVAWFGPVKPMAKKPTAAAARTGRLPAPVTEKRHARHGSLLGAMVTLGGRFSGFGSQDKDQKQNEKSKATGQGIARPSYTQSVDPRYVWVPDPNKADKAGAGVARDNTRTTTGGRLDRDNTRSTTAGGARLDRDNTRSTTATTRLGRDNTRSTTASARREPDRFTAAPQRTTSRRERADRERDRELERTASRGHSRERGQGREFERTRSRGHSRERSRDRTYDPPSRNNTRSTTATRTTVDSRRGLLRDSERERASERAVVVPAPPARAARGTGSSRKPDYYRRDLSPRR